MPATLPLSSPLPSFADALLAAVGPRVPEPASLFDDPRWGDLADDDEPEPDYRDESEARTAADWFAPFSSEGR